MDDLWLTIINEMEQRRQLGLKQYGVPVTAAPKIDWRKHLEEELLDGLVYNRAQMQLEKELANLKRNYKQLWDLLQHKTGMSEAEVNNYIAIREKVFNCQ